MTDISRALKTDGWCSERELQWLAEEASRHLVIIEIGSYVGRSTRALCDNTEGIVYAIDDFRGPREVNIPDSERETIFQRFMENTDGCKVVPVIADHSKINIRLRPDMVFIDGSHSYDNVKRDIEYWRSRVRPDGLICGHDYDWPGVRQAVDEIFPDAELVSCTSIWFVRSRLNV